MKTLLTLAAFAAIPAISSANLVVDTNLGTLGIGTTSYSGTTVGAPNNASYYAPVANSLANWDGERVYQFSISSPLTLSLTSPDTVDHDFFLLRSLATSVDAAGKTYGRSINSAFIDRSGTLGSFAAGTYYLSVDQFRGSNTTPPVAGGAFSFDLTAAAFIPPSPPTSTLSALGGSTSLDLAAGQVSFLSFDYTAGALSFDTEGSTIADLDTEIGLYDSLGILVGVNDDRDADTLSNLSFADGELPAGRYYLAVGAYDTTFRNGFNATSVSTSTGMVQVNGLSPVPEPATFAALGLGAVAMLRRRKRA